MMSIAGIEWPLSVLSASGKAPASVRRVTDRAMVLLLLMLVLLHRWWWADSAPDVDPINFTLALQSYDVTADRPHPPGYPLYVLLASMCARAVGSAHAFAAVNLALLVTGLSAVYWTLRSVGRPRIGLAIAALIASHPLVLATTVMPESYICDFAFSGLIAALVVGGARRPRLLAGLLAVLFFGFGLFRVVSCVLLTPLALGGVWFAIPRFERRAGRVVWAGIGMAVGIVAAYACTVWIGGGVQAYARATERVMGAAFHGTSVLGGAPLRVHLASAGKLVGWLLLLSAPAWGIRWAARWFDVRREATAAEQRAVSGVALLWIAPAFAFYLLIYYLKPSYQLIYLAPLVWIALQRVDDASQRGARYLTTAVAMVAAAQIALFAMGPRALPDPLYRLTHRFTVDRDWINSEIARAVSMRPATGVLTAWDAASDIPIQHMRLAIIDEPIALLPISKSDPVEFYNPWTATFGAPASPPERLRCALRILVQRNLVETRWVALPDDMTTWAAVAERLADAPVTDAASCGASLPSGGTR